jgi:hypothetical protein
MWYLNVLVMTAHIGYSFCYGIAVWRQLAMRGVEDAAPYEGREFDMPQQFGAVFYA